MVQQACGKGVGWWQDKFNDKHSTRYRALHEWLTIRCIEHSAITIDPKAYTLVDKSTDRHQVVIKVRGMQGIVKCDL